MIFQEYNKSEKVALGISSEISLIIIIYFIILKVLNL
jgi:hypothetical protein